MSDQPKVFVYGTLKPGGYYWPRFCEGRVVSAIPARVKGQLFALPAGYPALTHGDGWTHGYLLTLKDAAVLAGFDSLEGYEVGRRSEDNEYDRVEIDVYWEDGGIAGRSWTYMMSIDRINALKGVLISNGEWDVDDPDEIPALN
ncbi:MAG: gamma-glutamylcyclotransferase family protein [Verrucomicrobiota bacterium]